MAAVSRCQRDGCRLQGDIQDLAIIGDPSAAYDMCLVYRPDCDPQALEQQPAREESSVSQTVNYQL